MKNKMCKFKNVSINEMVNFENTLLNNLYFYEKQDYK